MENNNMFSIFPHGARNQKGEAVLATIPIAKMNLQDAYEFIRSKHSEQATETLRSMIGTTTKEEISAFKKLNFQVATFSGIFSRRRASDLLERTPYITIDIDNLNSREEARDVQHKLMDDHHVKTLLSFVSPSGLGTKGVVLLPEWCENYDFKTQFKMLQEYIAFEHGISIDASGSDVCRACFLPHDAQCMIKTDLLTF